jgi:hypothetical protein
MQSRDILYSPNKDGHSLNTLSSNPERAKATSFSNCWVCEGWREVEFEWRVDRSGPGCIEPIYIHFDFDDFKPTLMQLNPNAKAYRPPESEDAEKLASELAVYGGGATRLSIKLPGLVSEAVAEAQHKAQETKSILRRISVWGSK